MIIRPAKLKDIDGCVALSHIPELTTFYYMPDDDLKKQLIDFYKKGIFLVADHKNDIIGFIIGEYMLGNFIWVDGITVQEDYRGKGIGKKLFNKFRKIVKSKGIEHIYLMAPTSNKNTVKFYESLGMKKGKEFFEFWEDL